MRKKNIKKKIIELVIKCLKHISANDYVKAKKIIIKIWLELNENWGYQFDYEEFTFRELHSSQQQFLITLFEAIRLFDLKLYNQALKQAREIDLEAIIDYLIELDY